MANSPETFNLSDEQLEPFDAEFRDWPKYREVLSALLTKGVPATVLDVGGGNGRFLDHVLAEFPQCKGILVDNAEFMLGKNTTHPRKSIVGASALELDRAAPEASCDVITFNVLLHHLVGSSYEAATRAAISVLKSAARLLRDRGHIVVYEQVYDGLFEVIEPGAVIFAITRLRAPLLAPMLRRFGANSAGIGVCFRSHKAWTALFRSAELRLIAHRSVHQDSPPFIRRAALLVRQVGTHIYVLGK